MKKIEILAPAGNEECAYAAINAGADAIYLGLTSFSARDSAENFDVEKLTKLCAYAAVLGVKVYVALNTIVKDGEVEDFIKSAVAAHNAGASAVIIQDIYLGSVIKKMYPQITLHLSTQAGACNDYAARMAKEHGFSRIIAARETSLDNLSTMSDIIECEAFVQGALCTCFSGQCYFSSFVGGNSGNRGRCKQPCRKKYSWNRSGYESFAYRLSLSDLCVGEDIAKLVEAGVSSFKIEGRLRRPEYVAAAVIYYKKLLEGIAAEQDKINLKRAYNRGNYTKGLAFGQDKSFLSSAVAGHIGEFVGNVSVQNGNYICKSLQICDIGDGFKILRSGEEIGGASFGERVKGGFTLKTSQRLKNGDKVFLTTDSNLLQRLNLQCRKRDCTVNVKIFVGMPIVVGIDDRRWEIGDVVERAQSRPLNEFDVKRCFNKTDKFPFNVDVTVEMDSDAFIPASKLNAVRREAYQRYFDSFLTVDKVEFCLAEYSVKSKNNHLIAVIARNLDGLSADIGILKPDDYTDIDENSYKNFRGEKFIYVPAFMTTAEVEKLITVVKPFDGIYCDGVWGEQLSKEINKPLFAGTGFNISNGIQLGEVQAKYVALSKEISISEAKKLSGANTFYLAAGNIKLMDLIYCPFEKTCSKCDKKNFYELTDEGGRVFPVRRYKTSNCRFEVYNCADLISKNDFCGSLVDCTLGCEKLVCGAVNDEEKLKKIFKNYTRGHSANTVL